MLTLAKTCERVENIRVCERNRDWSILALQNIRTGKAHYLVICTCPESGILGPCLQYLCRTFNVVFFRRSHRPDRGSVRQGAGYPRVRDALPRQREEAAQEGPGDVGEREGGRDKPGVSPGPGSFLGRVLRKMKRENESDMYIRSCESDAWTAWGPVLQVRPRAQTQALTPDSVPEHYRSYPKLNTHSMNIQAITSLERGAIERKVEYRTYSQKLILDLERLCNQIIMKVVQK